ncbi:HHL191Wp [Eremothecium sinecaudum]|uniref:Elongin-C n=1 Tax=Eremothecium sinecaudum TaxID=45286 RepID=A0A0X8HW41_9SACH|nr:HHL191Wp [Eremothecium sinecaudum]AMD22579.1 HHL191Wp [Eremothecium sinecaudum]
MEGVDEVTLVSGNGEEFKIPEQVALQSPTLSKMLSSSFLEQKERRIVLSETDGKILSKVIEYLNYVYDNKDKDADEDIPEFNVPPEISLELLLVADYLQI